MKKYCFWMLSVLSLLAFASGCHSLHVKKQAVLVESEVPVDNMEMARHLQRSGDYLRAVMQYRQVIDCTHDPYVRDLAKIGAAECLMKSNQIPAALVALEPLPLQVRGETEGRKLALAGEILLRQKRDEEAKAYLEIALNSVDLEGFAQQAQCGQLASVEGWIPNAAANLGCACVQLDQPEHAMVMYQFAAMMYKVRGDHMAAQKAQGMYDDLAGVLRQYAPFKPVPVVKGFPAGRL